MGSVHADGGYDQGACLRHECGQGSCCAGSLKPRRKTFRKKEKKKHTDTHTQTNNKTRHGCPFGKTDGAGRS